MSLSPGPCSGHSGSPRRLDRAATVKEEKQHLTAAASAGAFGQRLSRMATAAWPLPAPRSKSAGGGSLAKRFMVGDFFANPNIGTGKSRKTKTLQMVTLQVKI